MVVFINPNLKIPLAFLGVILIWSVTPLLVQWSSVDAPLKSVLLRMILGFIFCLGMLYAFGSRLPLNRFALLLYSVTGVSIFLSMSLIYRASQEVPSGWIAVLYGLSPLFTGILSAFFEPESKLSINRIIGIICGLIGLHFIFKTGLHFYQDTLFGIKLVLLSVFIAATSSVIIRHLSKNSSLRPMQITSGSLLISIPLFALSAYFFEADTQLEFSQKTALCILFLGIIATGIGFTLYYFLLKNISANKVALVTLITPVTALLLGNLVNNEPIVNEVWIGTSFICIGLILYQYRPRFGLGRI